MVVVKRNSKSVSTTIIETSSFDGNATQLNYRKLSRSSKTQDKTPAMNGALRSAPPLTSGAKWCNLCLSEKLAILRVDPNTSLNKKFELNEKYRHTNKFKLKDYS